MAGIREGNELPFKQVSIVFLLELLDVLLPRHKRPLAFYENNKYTNVYLLFNRVDNENERCYYCI